MPATPELLRALGVLCDPPEPDHLAALLGLYATLGEAERDERDRARQALWRQAHRALLWEHLLTWAVTYAQAVAASAPPFHAAWAELLELTLVTEAADLEPPATPPLHLRGSPGLPEPSEGADALIGVLLAPARSGLILTRWDLARGAAGLGLGLRMGERAETTLAMLLELERATKEVTAHAAGR